MWNVVYEDALTSMIYKVGVCDLKVGNQTAMRQDQVALIRVSLVGMGEYSTSTERAMNTSL